MSEWFRRQSAKIKTTDKREIVEGMWLKCPQCQEVLYRTMLEENHYTCTNCTHHFRITSNDYIQLLRVLNIMMVCDHYCNRSIGTNCS